MDIGKLDFEGLDKIVEEYLNSDFDFTLENIEKNFISKIKKKDIKKIETFLEEKKVYDSIDTDSFVKRLDIRWGKLFNKIQYLIDFSLYSIVQGQSFIDKSNVKNHVLIQLHAKQILLSKEILVLLKNGYGEGANARWRSLYENIIITLLITQSNDELAIRFLEHKDIFNYKEAKIYKESYKKLKHKGYGKENYEELEKRMFELKSKYGKEFMKDYGWLTDEISKSKNFSEVEKIVDMTHFKPYYKMSSRSIHSSAKSFDNLGTKNNDFLLVGASNIGLVDPIQNTAMFILKGTTFILLDFVRQLKNKDMENKIILLYLVKIISGLEKGIGKDAINIQSEIDLDELYFKEHENV